MKVTRLICVLVFVIAILSNCNAQDKEDHRYVVDFYKHYHRLTENNLVYITGTGQLDNILRADNDIFIKISSTAITDVGASSSDFVQCDIDNKLLLDVLAAFYPEILDALTSAINNSQTHHAMSSLARQSEATMLLQLNLSREEFQKQFEEALLESTFFKDMMHKYNEKHKDDNISESFKEIEYNKKQHPLIIPCYHEAVSDANYYRELGIGEHKTRAASINIATQNAQSLLMERINILKQKAINCSMYNISLKEYSDQISFYFDTNITCQEVSIDTDGFYNSYIVIEVSKEDVVNNIINELNRISKEHNLGIDFREEKFVNYLYK